MNNEFRSINFREIEREKERKTKKEENKNLNYCSVGLES